MRTLVTGVAGFIGSHVAQRLLADGHAVFGVDDFSNGRPENVPEGVEFLRRDLSNSRVIDELPGQVDVILHLAGQASGEKSFDDPLRDLICNVDSTINLIRYGILRKARRLIYASSMSVYGAAPDAPIAETHACAPLSCYGVAKLAGEHYLRIFQERLPFVTFRIFNVYGPGQNMEDLRKGMVSIFLSQALKSGRVTVKGALTRFRDFIYVDDVVEACVRAMTTPAAENQIINLGTGRRTTVEGLLRQIQRHVDSMSWRVEGSTPGDQTGIFADNAKLAEVVGVNNFISLEDGLRRFADWARERIKEHRQGRKNAG